jgi:hypothetical protein
MQMNIMLQDAPRIIPLEETPGSCTDFDERASRKFVLDPHGLVG